MTEHQNKLRALARYKPEKNHFKNATKRIGKLKRKYKLTNKKIF